MTPWHLFFFSSPWKIGNTDARFFSKERKYNKIVNGKEHLPACNFYRNCSVSSGLCELPAIGTWNKKYHVAWNTFKKVIWTETEFWQCETLPKKLAYIYRYIRGVFFSIDSLSNYFFHLDRCFRFVPLRTTGTKVCNCAGFIFHPN